MRIYVDTDNYWKTRTPTKKGYVGPRVRTGSARIGEASTAMGRKQERAFDRKRDENRVQLMPGVIVIYDRKPYRIVELRELPTDLWGEKWDARFESAVADWDRSQPRGTERPEKATWRGRPFGYVLQPDGKPHEELLHLIGPANYSWDVLPEHYAICNACGELPPCSHEINEGRVRESMDRAEELMAIPPGHCLGCTELITSRQKATRFPGPNLWRPDLPENSAVFHARQECSTPREQYHKQWEARGGMKQQAGLFAGEETDR